MNVPRYEPVLVQSASPSMVVVAVVDHSCRSLAHPVRMLELPLWDMPHPPCQRLEVGEEAAVVD